MDTMTRQLNFQSADYRQALGTFATGVTVVTAMSASGELAGLTANSFTSVSLDPPLILWCLGNTSDNLAVFQTAPYFAVNILAADQKEISNHFAKRQKDKFVSMPYRTGKGGAPLLEGCVTWLQCRMTARHEVGDHHVFIGEVEHIETTGRETLLYHQGSYAMSLPLPESAASTDTTADSAQGTEEDLYSLLLQAIHTYQERFESRQHQYAANNYEAKILLLLREQDRHALDELSRKVQLPRVETEAVLLQMEHQGLLIIGRDGNGIYVMLTEAGMKNAVMLWKLARQHESDALAVLGKGQAYGFRRGLRRLIQWDDH
jgi:flavin reductase (DIM6/NTAB) family NADH-FMN oxidoreductase RutF